jgi:hypothetical protein
MRVALTNLVRGRAMLRGAKVPVFTKPCTDTVSVDTHVQLLSAWKTEAEERKVAHTVLSKQLGDLHMRLMTPQLILSAATSTLAANNLQTPAGAPIATLTVIIAIICTVLSAITNFVEFNVVSEKHSVAARRYEALSRNLEAVTTREADELEMHVEMTALEFKHISDIAPVL